MAEPVISKIEGSLDSGSKTVKDSDVQIGYHVSLVDYKCVAPSALLKVIR